jgi:hypothetical protein
MARATGAGHGCVVGPEPARSPLRDVSTKRWRGERSLVRGGVRSAPTTNVQSANWSAVGPTDTNTRMRIDSSIREAKTTVKG